jgi:hypothetical protein
VPGKVFRSPLHGELCRFESDLGYSVVSILESQRELLRLPVIVWK